MAPQDDAEREEAALQDDSFVRELSTLPVILNEPRGEVKDLADRRMGVLPNVGANTFALR